MKKYFMRKNEISEVLNSTLSPRVRDVFYQSNSFYLLIDIGNDKSAIYKIDENALSVTENDKIYQPTSAFSFSQICVDLFGNIYLANNTKIIKTSKDQNNSYTITEDIIGNCLNIKKIATDLVGNLFVLDDGILKQVSNGQANEISVEQKISSFAFDFIDNDFYLLTKNDEFISTTNEIQTICIITLNM